MSATNKDSDKEAEIPSNDDGENPGGSKGDDGRGNPDNAEDDDGDYENLDDTSDEDSDYDNPEDAEDDNSTENPGGSKGDGGKENPGATPGQEIAGEGKFVWKDLDHNGPYFPPEYKPLPDNVHLYYGNDQLKLDPKTEEMATLYAKILDKLERESAETRTTFNKNFFEDWQKTMTDEEKLKITDWSECNFHEMKNHLAKKGAEKKLTPQEVKDFEYCMLDGREVEVENWQIKEPRCHFPKKSEKDENIGRIIKRVVPKDVIVNCSSTCALAKNQRDKWLKVIHKQNLKYLAKWRCNVTNKWNYMNLNYIFSRPKIFGLASELSNNIQKFRETYWKCLESDDKDENSMGVVLYIVDKFSIRSGTQNAKSPKGSTGVCTLKKSHITLKKKFSVTFNFIGKCGKTYQKTDTVEPKVYEILQELQKDKDSEYLFPRIDATDVNNRLNTIMPNLTIKVFRTYNGSLRMQNELEKATRDVAKGISTITVYKKALEIVAAYLNHQRAASSSGNQNSNELSGRMAAIEINEDSETSPTEKTGELPEGMEWNLQSTKQYYIDHRVVILWCKKNGIPIEDIYTEEKRKSYEWEIGEVEKLVKENTSFQTFYYYYIKVFDCKYLPMN
ncbi:DNA topoisomerase I, mitochondrial-like [Neodiprion pinetum]|uniref:DNA topoisomerase I, mitochondrial-like n=1 Tax=Neodiprion pinetum TaxID=441929 RepID=UPI001EDE0A07|nr:DNA topoisomerase I, mitochondrial-like [Neodiprion pinetum]